ncbi:DUF6174 domain-containing protein [Streptomyces ipomoeae]|uniref:DUF6174 domain-containing protein n=1 Tax=Streptomyces ipomoeae TaxID=103232 RepID=UPI0011474C64|nr:DUF6174 domain-containing protein [Streptomyces ipomoeae]MDX2938173.1 DUF6174 domain-containing protein [Streptomyces ipomoeae]TQE27014.1 hypothetical protein SipoB123_12565 [Streptomyces ipomoeae]
MTTTTAAVRAHRTLALAAMTATLMWATAACGNDSPTMTAKPGEPAWQEPASYTYTLNSSEGERSLIGTFEVTVENGKVTKAHGLDDSARRVVKDLPAEVPTIGDLLAEAEAAREDDADTVDIDYAADGHPTRISLDWEKNAIDDEALYVITDYAPAD